MIFKLTEEEVYL